MALKPHLTRLHCDTLLTMRFAEKSNLDLILLDALDNLRSKLVDRKVIN